jgi:hypothetical protein
MGMTICHLCGDQLSIYVRWCPACFPAPEEEEEEE